MSHIFTHLFFAIAFLLSTNLAMAQEQAFIVKGIKQIELDGETSVQLTLEIPKEEESSFMCPRASHYDRSLIQFNDKVDPFISVVTLSTVPASLLAVKEIPQYKDKYRHFFAGYLVGASASGVYSLYIRDKDVKHPVLKSILVGIGSSLVVGMGKELYDKVSGKGTPDLNDAWATGLGGIGGSVTINISDIRSLLKKK